MSPGMLSSKDVKGETGSGVAKKTSEPAPSSAPAAAQPTQFGGPTPSPAPKVETRDGGLTFINRGNKTARIQIERRVGGEWTRDSLVTLGADDMTNFDEGDDDTRVVIDWV